jgi:hypothetical protein
VRLLVEQTHTCVHLHSEQARLRARLFSKQVCTCAHLCGEHACICAHLWVCKRACVHACGLKNRTVEARLMGVKRVFLMFLIVHVANLGRFYVVQVSFVHDAYCLVRAGLVPAARRRGY